MKHPHQMPQQSQPGRSSQPTTQHTQDKVIFSNDRLYAAEQSLEQSNSRTANQLTNKTNLHQPAINKWSSEQSGVAAKAQTHHYHDGDNDHMIVIMIIMWWRLLLLLLLLFVSNTRVWRQTHRKPNKYHVWMGMFIENGKLV